MRVLLFAHLKNVAGAREVRVAGGPYDVEGFWRALGDQHPALERFRPSVRLALNGEYASQNVTFHEDDEVALIPPVSGG